MKKTDRKCRLKASVLCSCLLCLTLLPLSGADEAAVSEQDLSSNPIVRKSEIETLAKLKKAKPDEEADLLYSLGKFAFGEKDFVHAEKYLRLSLEKEKPDKRPDRAVETNIALAILLTSKRDLDAAVSQYKAALQIAEKAKLATYLASITNSTGTICLLQDKAEDADEYFKKAYVLAGESKDIWLQMNALTNQALVMRKRKKNSEALELLKQALELSKQGEEDRSLGLALVNVARVQHDQGFFDNAVSSYQRAAEVFNKDFDPESEADAYFGMADTLFEIHKTNLARQAYEKGLEAIKDEPDSDLKIKILIGLGCAEADMGHFDKAQEFHKRACDIAQTANNRERELQAILQMGNDLLLSGYPEAALFRLLDGEKLIASSNLEASVKGNFHSAIGRCYKVLGEFDAAQKYYEEALKMYEALEDKQNRALSLLSLAVLALDTSNKSDFEIFYKEAKSAYEQIDDKRELAILDYNYAQFNITQKKYAEAIESSSKALDEIRQSGDRVSEAMILRGIGLAQLLGNQPQQAMPYYEKALSIADESADIEGQWDSHLGLGKCFKRLGLNDMAASHLLKAVDLVEEERGRLARDSFKTHTLDLRNDCFVELVDLYITMNKPYDALAVAEKGRARAFLDMLSSRKSGRSVETFLSPISSRTPGGAEPSNLIAMAAPESGTRGVSVIPRASQIYASTAISPVNASAPSIEEMKSLVKASASSMVIYYNLPDKIAVWVLDPDTTIHMLPPIRISRQDLAEKVSLCHESITHHPKSKEEIDALAKRRQDMLKELYNTLIKPVESYLPQKEESLVTIVPHGPLFMIPFAALMSADGKFFIEKHTLSYIPAIGVYRATQKLEQSFAEKENKLLAFGNPITKAIAFLGALPYSEKEVQNIAALFGLDKATVKIKDEANKRAFESLASQYSQIHLATHGLVDEEHPMQSSLVLAPSKGDDGLLSVKDILAMKDLKAKLVVLSACQTGRGKITGDGVVGLSRAFIIAGTPSVVVSQWNVDDIITEYQMKSFYKGYLDKAGKAKSLRQSQLDTIKFMEGADYGKGTNGVRANPRYWAAFQLIGECG